MKRRDKGLVNMKSALFCSAVISLFAGETLAEMRFVSAGDMIAAASQHRDVVLQDGRVLITGGQSGEGGIADAQIYDPATRKFVSAGKMTEPRFVHAMNLLSDGRVLVTAGFSKAGQFLQTSEFFDGTTFVKGQNLVENRDNQRTVNLSSGKVFIEGGDNEKAGYIASSEIFDPKSNTFFSGPTLPTDRAMDTITRLSDGKVLMAGGMKIIDFKQVFLKDTVVYDEKTNTVAAGPQLKSSRKQHKAVMLADGRVLFTGGMNESGVLSSSEIYKKGKISKAANMGMGRSEHCSVLLSSGKVLIAGGYTGKDYSNTTEIFDPKTEKFSKGPDLITGRTFHTCTVLRDGSVLVAGGSNRSGAIKAAELLTF